MIGALILLVLLGVLFIFLKYRNSIGASKNGVVKIDNTVIKHESLHSQTNAGDGDLIFEKISAPENLDYNVDHNIDHNMEKQKQQQNKRGGYSKQQFDEFE